MMEGGWQWHEGARMMQHEHAHRLHVLMSIVALSSALEHGPALLLHLNIWR
jgi:hypothetical protein